VTVGIEVEKGGLASTWARATVKGAVAEPRVWWAHLLRRKLAQLFFQTSESVGSPPKLVPGEFTSVIQSNWKIFTTSLVT